jgi:lipopolysaccharide/colanic/teichoic acid biosynthesis glycosyltransferase
VLLEEFNPRITGRTQLIEACKGPMTAEQRITEDLHYVENWSLLLDFKTILMRQHLSLTTDRLGSLFVR